MCANDGLIGLFRGEGEDGRCGGVNRWVNMCANDGLIGLFRGEGEDGRCGGVNRCVDRVCASSWVHK